jgi:hypothetical protein
MKLIPLTALAHMSGILPTVTIKTKNGAVRINESDFDPDQMELFDAVTEPAAPAPTEPAAPAPTEPQQLLVMKSGRKFFIRDNMGGVVEAEGINPDGYSTEAAALEALTALTA